VRTKLPHELLKDLVDSMTFNVSYDAITDNFDGTYVLTGVCKFHHVRPLTNITIEGNAFEVLAYNYDEKTITVKGTGLIIYLTDDDGNYITDDNGNKIITNTPPLSFYLSKPFFFHGTPLQQTGELTKLMTDEKLPMIYLMEPYNSENYYSPISSLAYWADLTLCFLCESISLDWTTEQHYERCIFPMKNLMEDVIQAIIDSQLFHTEELQANPTYHTKFGINVNNYGTKEFLMDKNLSGCSTKIRLEVYQDEGCEC
jgi:hypothetical protein